VWGGEVGSVITLPIVIETVIMELEGASFRWLGHASTAINGDHSCESSFVDDAERLNNRSLLASLPCAFS
jgi:hypothetical protein